MRLEDWIDPRHLDSATQTAYRSAFTASPHSSIAIDHFLRADKFELLQLVFSTEGTFEERHYLWEWAGEGRSEKTVSAEAWRAAPLSQRAFVERVFTAPRPEHHLGRGSLTHYKFVELLSSPEFMDFLATVSGIRPPGLSGLLMRIMAGGQYIPPHSDCQPIRDLCAVFYASGGWQEGFGGRFRHCEPGVAPVPVEPLANRMLLFEPKREARHDVEPVALSDGAWQRWSYSIWFGRSDAPSK
jgi:hypothetical protein